MTLRGDISLARGYKSASQIARVVSESWFSSFGYCLSCQSNHLDKTPANTKASDFVCPDCSGSYELKTSAKQYKRILNDGAYEAMMSRILSDSPPTLLLLERNKQWEIQRLTAVHPMFLTPSVIVRRKPLAPTAQRAGWVGCNVRLDLIVEDARIAVIGNGVPNEQKLVRAAFKKFEQLKEIKPTARGWTTLTLQMVRSLGVREFTSKQIYALESKFATVYPQNHNIRPKIRQQLQILRDLGYIKFHGDGSYEIAI